MANKHLVLRYEFYDEESGDVVQCEARLPFPFNEVPDDMEFLWYVENLDS